MVSKFKFLCDSLYKKYFSIKIILSMSFCTFIYNKNIYHIIFSYAQPAMPHKNPRSSMPQFDQMIIVVWRVVELISCDGIISLINCICLRWHANGFIAAWSEKCYFCMAKEDKRKKTKNVLLFLFIYLSLVLGWWLRHTWKFNLRLMWFVRSPETGYSTGQPFWYAWSSVY
jgi:hypothetical protein